MSSLIPASSAFTPQIQKEMWIDIFTYLDRESIGKVEGVCKYFNKLAEDPKVEKFIDRHPLETFIRFYIKNDDTQKILNQFQILDPIRQNQIKTEAWVEGGRKTGSPDSWIEIEMQNNIKGETLCKTIVAFGQLVPKLSALKDFRKVVEDHSQPSENVFNALEKLARFKYGDSSPHRNLEEEVKFSIWQKNDTVSDDVNFSYNFIKNNPHEETIKQITKDIEDDLFATHRVSNANPRLKSLAATLIFKDFLSFYDKSDDRAAILHKFSTLAPIYQKLIKVSISKAGGKQAAPLGDWAMEEMKSNMKGPLVSSAIKKIKELSPVTLEKANSILVQLALFEFIEIVEGNAQSSNDVIRVLNNLDKEFFEDDHWSVAKWIKCRVWEQIDPLNWVKCKKERDGIEYIRFDEVHEKQAFNFIKENPHDQIIIMAINKL